MAANLEYELPKRRKIKRETPVVGIFVDGVTAFGRSIMRGAMRFANLQRRWQIVEVLRNQFTPERWPRFDAAIVAGTSTQILDFVFENCPRVVRCSGSGDPKQSAVVCLDDFAIGELAAIHLMDKRLRSFGFYGKGTPLLSRRRYEGFAETLAQHGFTCSEAGVGWSTAMEETSNEYVPALLAWLRDLPKPVGILAVDDTAAHDLAAACRAADIAVPHQIAIVGVNNDDLLCESAWPPLSSVEGDYARVGYEAARLIEQMLAGKKLPISKRLIVLRPLGVVQRQSTDLLAVDDPHLSAAIQYIQEHACDPCSVRDVLKQVPVGRRWLERQFVTRLGRTPHDEIMHVRIEAAKRMLLQPDLKTGEIAKRFGSSAIQNFNRTFEQYVGKTPFAWRNDARRGTR